MYYNLKYKNEDLLWTTNFVFEAFGNFVSHIMNYALSNMLQLTQYTFHTLRDLEKYIADTTKLYTAVLPTNFVAQHTPICNFLN